jgi:hypothetical protein
MRPATKHWLFLIFLVVSLAILVAVAFRQMARARRDAPGRSPPAARAGGAWPAPHRALARGTRSA